MRRPNVVVLALLFFAAPALAEVRAGQNVVVRADEAILEDLYAAGSVVRVDGIVEGDLVAVAGTVEVNGEVRGDLLFAAGNARVPGKVLGSVRGVGGGAVVSGAIGEDLVVAGGRLQLAPAASVGRDVLVGSGEVDLDGPVAGDVTAGAGRLRLASEVGGDANVTADELTVAEAARIGGTLTYQSANEAAVAAGSEVGSIVRRPAEIGRPAWVGFLYGWLRAVIAFSALGVLLAAISPRFARAVPDALAADPWRSLAWGAVALVAAPLVAVTLFGAGAVLGGWWLGLVFAGAFATALAVAVPAVGYLLGHRVLERRGAGTWWRVAALVLGTAGITLAIQVPVLGALVVLATGIFGVGAMLRAGVRLRRPAPAA